MNKITEIANEIKTPAEALLRLQEGNFRFINDMTVNRDLLSRINETKDQQTPFAAVLSCMDSRVTSELVFDLGLGDIFSIRIAGNIISTGVLGSLEYATSVAGARLILVMGHTNCGAIKGACDNVKMGHLSALLQKIQPAIIMEKAITEDRTSSNPEFVKAVTKLNIHFSISEILERSSIIKDLVDKGKIEIVPALYDVATGKVQFSDI